LFKEIQNRAKSYYCNFFFNFWSFLLIFFLFVCFFLFFFVVCFVDLQRDRDRGTKEKHTLRNITITEMKIIFQTTKKKFKKLVKKIAIQRSTSLELQMVKWRRSWWMVEAGKQVKFLCYFIGLLYVYTSIFFFFIIIVFVIICLKKWLQVQVPLFLVCLLCVSSLNSRKWIHIKWQNE